MSERADRLHTIANGQTAKLIMLLSGMDEATLRRPCPGRQRLGDGTVAASVQHTADNYRRIAAFVLTSDQISPTPAGDGHRVPRALQAFGHARTSHATGAPEVAHDDVGYTSEKVDRDQLLEELPRISETLKVIARLTDDQLDSVPLSGSFRFCDGERNFEQVLASLLRHQAHQLEAIEAATA